MIVSSSPKYKDFVLNIKEYFNREDNKILFNKRNIIKVIDFKDNKYAVKSFKVPHLLNKIVYKYFRQSKAKRSYDNSKMLLSLNVNTPKPIGFLECGNFLFSNSYYISEFFDYDFEIRDVFNNKEFENREEILNLFVEFSYDLHNKGVYHVDYSPGNVIIKKNDNEYIFSLIDVNRMKFLDFDVSLRMKSMAKLTSNKEDIEILVNKYSIISEISKNELSILLNKYVDDHQQYIQNKKKFKKLKKQ